MQKPTALIWQNLPDNRTQQTIRAAHPDAVEVFINDQARLPEGLLLAAANEAMHFIPSKTDTWLIPQHQATQLAQYGFGKLIWCDGQAIEQKKEKIKPWLRLPEPQPIVGEILVVGAGIAGASTAYALARRGYHVNVVEAQADCALAASGNHQGLLYAKISPHSTIQTRLLLSGYGFSRRLLTENANQTDFWSPCGVLHLNHDEKERQRNAQLAQKTHNQHIYQYVDKHQTAQLAGIPLNGQDGLFWPQGASIAPRMWVKHLLSHPNIRLHTDTAITHLERRHNLWLAHTKHPSGSLIFAASHIVFCNGNQPLPPPLEPLPLQFIRGQTTLGQANETSRQLRCAISGASYISPAYQDQHCYGASFVPHDTDTAWRADEDIANHHALGQLSHTIATALAQTLRGHTALRTDCHDHLPAVGPLGDFAAMRQRYAKLAHDKNYRLDHIDCPYETGIYINTAHGSRGLCTAPISGELIASQILSTPSPLEPEVCRAIMPNRLLIRQLIYGHNQAT